MKPTSLVSIITPTFNREKYLALAIESVLNQLHDNFELLIIDDGSTDNTRKLVGRYQSDKRIHYFYQNNQGQSVARNTGLREANGKYICFLDSDDLFAPDKLSKQVSFLEHNPSIPITYSDEELIDEEGHVFSTHNMKRHSGILYEKLLIDNFVSITTIMVRRECFDEMGMFDETIKVADDYELWLRFSTKYEFHYEPQYFAQYRVMREQISSDKTSRFNSNKRIIESFFLKFPDLIDKNKKQQIRCHFYTRWGLHEAADNNFRNAIRKYIKALGHSFFYLHTWKSIVKLIIKYITSILSR